MNLRLLVLGGTTLISAALAASDASAYYAAHLGRWVNRDPIGYQERDYNLYQYVHSSPIVATDPQGLFAAHGNFCGPTRAAGCNGNQPHPGNPAPIDALDAACEQHDCCLATWKDCLKFYPCNCALCAVAKGVDCSISPNPASCVAMKTSIFSLCSAGACPGFIYLPILVVP
jgi:hypothetical protein